MTIDFVSLAFIVIVSTACPIIAHAIPNKLIPESVFLLVAGCILGPNCLGFINVDEVVSFLSDLGLAFLFLLAGMEIDPKRLVDHQGRRALLTWTISLGIATAVTMLAPSDNSTGARVAASIALVTTAFGTLVPIMKERGLGGTPVGDAITAYGTWGELAPVLAIAILLSTRAATETIIILAAFLVICIVLAVLPKMAKKDGTRVYRFLSADSNPTYQTMMRFTIMILVILLAVSSLFDLDIVLGAFAAGFVMRYIIPEGDERLETKLNAAAYGFFIPIFFVVSGSKVNISAIGAMPLLLVIFIILLILIRGVPIFISLYTDKRSGLSVHNKWTVAIYCTTALPLIVAVTSIAVEAGTMSQDSASVLVAAGAITVFLMPMLASLTYRVADAKPVEAIEEIGSNPKDIGKILREHAQLARMVSLELALDRIRQQQERVAGGAAATGKKKHRELTSKEARLEDLLERARRDLDAELGDEEGKLADEKLDRELEKIRETREEFLSDKQKRAEERGERIARVNDVLARRAVAEARRHRADLQRNPAPDPEPDQTEEATPKH